MSTERVDKTHDQRIHCLFIKYDMTLYSVKNFTYLIDKNRIHKSLIGYTGCYYFKKIPSISAKQCYNILLSTAFHFDNISIVQLMGDVVLIQFIYCFVYSLS